MLCKQETQQKDGNVSFENCLHLHMHNSSIVQLQFRQRKEFFDSLQLFCYATLVWQNARYAVAYLHDALRTKCRIPMSCIIIAYYATYSRLTCSQGMYLLQGRIHVLGLISYKSHKLQPKVLRLRSLVLETLLINFRKLSVLLTLNCIISDKGQAMGLTYTNLGFVHF